MTVEPTTESKKALLRKENEELKQTVAKLKEDVAKANSEMERYKGYYHSKDKEVSSLNEEIESVQCFIDALPDAPARKRVKKECEWSEPKDYSLIVRLSLYFASKAPKW